MQYARFPVGKSRKNRVTDKESEGFAFFCTNLNDWDMSDIFNSSHFFTGTNEVLPEQPRNPGRSRNLLGEQEGKALHIANLLFLPFYLFRYHSVTLIHNILYRSFFNQRVEGHFLLIVF